MKKGQMLGAIIIEAAHAHAGQYDRAGQPYILHTLKVMHYLKTEDEELQSMAVGHDLLEDTKTTIKRLREIGMSERVIAGILALTRMPGESEEEYQDKDLASRDACLVKKADLRHNSDIRRLKGVTEKDIARIVKYHNFYLRIEEKLRTMDA